MKRGSVTFVLLCATVFVLVLSVPSSLREAHGRGTFYIFSDAFFTDLPKRLTGPGKFRFILQPLVAIVLGIRMGLADRRKGRPPYLYELFFASGQRRELMKSAITQVANLLLMGILMDSIFQWVLFGSSYPGAALVVGPVLIVTPYAVARALANRAAGLRRTAPAP